MAVALHAARCAVVMLCGLAAVACGGGGKSTLAGSSSSSSSSGGSSSGSSSSGASNVVSAVIDAGPTGANNNVNELFTTVTVCVPGSSTDCTTIEHIQVDTGSSGLRILASLIPASMTLPPQSATDGNALAECFVYADMTYNWGPIVTANVQIGGEKAANLPVQLISVATSPAIPANCANSGTPINTVATLSANGILGVSPFAQDCGTNCASDYNGFYYSCTSTECLPIAVPTTSQVPNPITKFTTDNNGLIVDLPSVPEAGAASLTGSLIFGIGTESNNAASGLTIVPLDSTASFTAVYRGQTLGDSFIDTGSNGWFFDDTTIAQCTGSADLAQFYCPPSAVALSATIEGVDTTSAPVPFTIGNYSVQSAANPTFVVFATLGGTNSDTSSFDFGLPFYMGRRVYHVIEGDVVDTNTGPFIAFAP
jgi:hypothetical protein